MELRVGDIVEVIKAFEPYEEEWVGRQLVVTDIAYGEGWYWPSSRELYNGPIVNTVPNFKLMQMFEHRWAPEQLKRIEPPDWEAKVTELGSLYVKS